MKYGITKTQCQKIINDLVRHQCGGELEPHETVDNSKNPTFWAHCPKCSIYDWGINSKTQRMAEMLVVNYDYVHYEHLGNQHDQRDKSSEEKKHWKLSQVGGTCYLVKDILEIQEKINGELIRGI